MVQHITEVFGELENYGDNNHCIKYFNILYTLLEVNLEGDWVSIFVEETFQSTKNILLASHIYASCIKENEAQ